MASTAKREIKFRAWFKRYKLMSNWDDVKESLDLVGILTNPRYVVMQYTGLLDKNGVEIYEGDIVTNDYNGKFVVEYGIQEVDAFEGMGWNLWSFYDDDGHGYKANGMRLKRTYWVIGNIYENPELLT